MRKVFVEPELKRIELNLTENIATSAEEVYSGTSGGFSVTQYVEGCTGNVKGTGFSLQEISTDQGKFTASFGCLVLGMTMRQAAKQLGISNYEMY